MRWLPRVNRECKNGALEIESLNPEVKTKWAMSRMERFVAGVRLALTALR